MPFKNFDRKQLEESSSFAKMGHLPLQAQHITKYIAEKRKREKEPQTLEVLLKS